MAPTDLAQEPEKVSPDEHIGANRDASPTKTVAPPSWFHRPRLGEARGAIRAPGVAKLAAATVMRARYEIPVASE